VVGGFHLEEHRFAHEGGAGLRELRREYLRGHELMEEKIIKKVLLGFFGFSGFLQFKGFLSFWFF
jgi:hypothetical protein